ncbi:protein FAM169B isoform X4 [Python bivittatus]|uniref:Protein FAM169B isoform X4 n=1 Tax=Python bivittatus TaxID=176946 RepID=A0A9F5ILG7_PYTBI|nr:protein FAM169B isoform X4 [Python bivittatus]
MAAPSRLRAGRGGADCVFPMDIKDENLDILETGPHKNHAKRIEEASLAAEHFSVPGQENMKLETSSMSFLPLYRDDSKCTLLVLTDPQDKNRVLAIYLNNSWWLTEDVVKTSDPSREGLMQVQTFQERIVLFVLNCIIFGMLEGSLTHNTVFVPHPKKEHSKIFWRSGEAAAFYTIKKKVCQRFLEIYPKERSRLWEVEAPGDWTQRVNIWLKIQLEQTFPKNADVSCCMPKSQDGEAEQLEEGRMNTRVGCILPLGALPDEARACFDDSGEARESSPRSDEPLVQLKAEERKDLKKRMSRGEPAEGSVSKHFRTMS